MTSHECGSTRCGYQLRSAPPPYLHRLPIPDVIATKVRRMLLQMRHGRAYNATDYHIGDALFAMCLSHAIQLRQYLFHTVCIVMLHGRGARYVR